MDGVRRSWEGVGLEEAGRASVGPGRVSDRALRVSERAGRASDRSGRASEGAKRVLSEKNGERTKKRN